MAVMPAPDVRMCTVAYHHGDLPAALLAAVREAITDNGVSGVSMRDVARRAGVSHSAPAHHFGSKAGLLMAFAAEGFRLLAQAMRSEVEAQSTADAVAQVAAVGQAYSPDGTQVATASGNESSSGSARVFDAATGAEISRLDHDRGVNAVAFSPDGTRVATSSEDRSVRVWWTDPGRLVEQAASRLTRNLTQQEWRRYFRDEPYRKMWVDLP
jgi:AcrR family transcriptional regulator